MDRLSALMHPRNAIGALVSVSLLLGACDDPPASAKSPAVEERVNAVMASRKAPSFADLCDVAPNQAQPKPFIWPAMAQSPQPSSTRYRWVNVWATWCKPCVEELPLLTRVLGEWHKQGHDVTLTLVSVDSDASAANAFIAQHPGVPSTLQLSDASQTTAWLTSLGLATGSSIPVHMVLDAQGNLLCARSGGIGQDDLDRFAKVMFP